MTRQDHHDILVLGEARTSLPHADVAAVLGGAFKVLRDGLAKAIHGAASFIAESRERARARHALSTMDDRLLRDIGITRLDVLRETSKSLWKD